MEPLPIKIHAEFYPKTRREFFKTRRVLKNSPYVFPEFSACFCQIHGDKFLNYTNNAKFYVKIAPFQWFYLTFGIFILIYESVTIYIGFVTANVFLYKGKMTKKISLWTF